MYLYETLFLRRCSRENAYAVGLCSLERFGPVIITMIVELIQARANVECPECGGDGWLCKEHKRPYEACGCGGVGVPCRCTGARELETEAQR